MGTLKDVLTYEEKFRYTGLVIADYNDVFLRDSKGQFVIFRETSMVPTNLLAWLGAPHIDDMAMTGCLDKATGEIIGHRATGNENLIRAAKALDVAFKATKLTGKDVEQAISQLGAIKVIPIPLPDDPQAPYLTPMDVFCSLNSVKAMREQKPVVRGK